MSKKWILILLSLVILLPVMLLTIGVVVLNTADLKEHRETIAEHISQATGRQLSLNGEFELNISTKLSIVVTDITLANAEWSSEPEMLTIQRVDVEIMLLPLLAGKVHLPRFHLEGVKALAETNVSGISNWMFTEGVDDEVAVDAAAGRYGELYLPWITDMHIVDVEFNYHDRQAGQNITSKLDHVRIGATDKDSPAVIDIVGEVSGDAVPDLGKINLSAKLKTQPSELRLSDFELRFGKGRIHGWLILDTSESKPNIQSEISVSDLNLDNLLPTKPKTVKAKAKPAKEPEAKKLFSEELLPFDMLSQANIKATLRVHNLVRHKRLLKEIEVGINLVDGKLSASILKYSYVRDEFVADFVIDASGIGEPNTTLTLKVPHLELSKLLTTGGRAAAVEGPLAIDVFLKAKGNSVAQLMGSLDGNIKLLMEQGRADAKALDRFVGGLYTMVGTIFIDRSSKTKINCAICDFKLEDGKLTSQLAVLDTQYSTVFVDGQVDLEKEQLDIKVSPKAKSVTLRVAYPVHLYGKLNKPSVEIEKTDAILKSAELWANIVYPPSALVKFSDLGGGRKNPCVSIVAEKTGYPKLEGTGKVVGDAVNGVGNAVKDVDDDDLGMDD